MPLAEVALPDGVARVWDLGDARADRTFVLLHGIAGSRRVFFRLAPLLAGRGRVVVPALRGEDRPCPRVTWDRLADDLAAVLDGLDLADATLVGTSFGGCVALALAARRSPRVGRVVVQGGFAGFRLRTVDRLVLAAAALLPPALGERYFAHRVRQGRENRLVAEHAPGFETLLPAWSAQTPFATLRGRIRLITREPLDARRLARVATPVTLVRGTEDKVVPRRFHDQLRAMLPHAAEVELEGAGHLPALTHPDDLAAAVLSGRS